MSSKTINKAKQFTRGGQITFHNIRMLLQVNRSIWNIYLPALLILVIGGVYLVTPSEVLQNAYYWCLAQINPLLESLNVKLQLFRVPYHGKIYGISPKNYLSHPHLVKTTGAISCYLKTGAIIGDRFYVKPRGILCFGKVANGPGRKTDSQSVYPWC
jgi:hypothetical protein